MELISQVFTENGFIGGLLLLIIVGIGYGFYKISKILIELLREVLNSFLEKFGDMVHSITELTKKEDESKKLNSEEHLQNSKEHLKIIAVLEAILGKLTDKIK